MVLAAQRYLHLPWQVCFGSSAVSHVHESLPQTAEAPLSASPALSASSAASADQAAGEAAATPQAVAIVHGVAAAANPTEKFLAPALVVAANSIENPVSGSCPGGGCEFH